MLFGQYDRHFPQPLQASVTTAVLFFITIASCGQCETQVPNPIQPQVQPFSVS